MSFNPNTVPKFSNSKDSLCIIFTVARRMVWQDLRLLLRTAQTDVEIAQS